mmetsp:Transcript_11329/g.32638  ORF Transcript_11329/g.32638 Transcript_11329/m.32638 type:complete len:119 (-) Transcript_11329:78-434(-)
MNFKWYLLYPNPMLLFPVLRTLLVKERNLCVLWRDLGAAPRASQVDFIRLDVVTRRILWERLPAPATAKVGIAKEDPYQLASFKNFSISLLDMEQETRMKNAELQDEKVSYHLFAICF